MTDGTPYQIFDFCWVKKNNFSVICQTKALEQTSTKKYDIPILREVLTLFVQVESTKNAQFFKCQKYGQKYFFRKTE